MGRAKTTATYSGEPRRYRNFATIVYPESAPDNWIDVLSEQFIPAFVSPLHDKDINPTGEAKKPHYHVLLMFDGKKSNEQVQEIIKKFGGVGCEVVNSSRGYARYLCHLDNPDKHRYNTEDVKAFSGADYSSLIGLSIDRYKTLAEIEDYLDENDVISYAELIRYCRHENFEWYRVACDNTIHLTHYVKSRKWENENQYKK